ncbi:hypothetical protein CTI12_AA175650 [Artemisia annua]|uniref:DUF4283 domain-containing protein n=1 Tax=Artemisia annua TaxID=35608 RepID=A0A2U1NM39_ARTAN|nr:hypothetical protein CTI12_AA175650 [Artemisia annua]
MVMSANHPHSQEMKIEDDLNVSRGRGRPRKQQTRSIGTIMKTVSPNSASAGAGSVLKRLRASKLMGKARNRVDSSPVDSGGGGVNNGLNPVNDGSFIKEPLIPSNDSVIDSDSRSHVANGSGSKDSVEQTGIGVVGNASSVRSTLLDSTISAKTVMDFEFGKVDSSKGILKKPSAPLLKVQFAEKLKKGSEELALKMEYMPSSMSKLENGGRRISFTAEEVIKGGVEIGKIMSGIGRPLLMDKMTRERCLRKAGKLDFARVLVEVSAVDDLPNVLEIAYPPIGNRPANVGKLEVKYQWKPPLCTHCKTFGHTTLSCKVRPRTVEESAAAILKESLKVSSVPKDTEVSTLNDDGFVTGNQQEGYSKGFRKQGSFGGNDKGKQQGGVLKKNSVHMNVSNNDNIGNVGNQKKTLRQLSSDPNFKPKVLVRGSGSGSNHKEIQEEVVPVSNSFDVLADEAMNDEYDSSVWLKLKVQVDDIMEAGIYPSKAIRADWSLKQMDYFYNNCHKFHLDPVCADDEDDVESESDGVAADIKPEIDVYPADALVNDSAKMQDLSNGI